MRGNTEAADSVVAYDQGCKAKKASGARSQCGMKLQCLASRNGCVAHVNNQLLDDFSGDVASCLQIN